MRLMKMIFRKRRITSKAINVSFCREEARPRPRSAKAIRLRNWHPRASQTMQSSVLRREKIWKAVLVRRILREVAVVDPDSEAVVRELGTESMRRTMSTERAEAAAGAEAAG